MKSTGVCYITNNPNLGSTARVFLDWFQYQRLHSFVPSVIVPGSGPLVDWTKKQSVSSLILDSSPFNSRTPIKSAIRFIKALFFVKKSEARLIHCMEHNVYPFAWRIAKLLKIPIVCHVQYKVDRGFCEWAFGGGHPPDQLVWTAHSQERDCIDAINGIVPDKLQMVIPMGVDVSRFGLNKQSGIALKRKFGLTDEHVIFGIACAFRKRKRIHEFIELVTNVRKRYPFVRGIIAGGPVKDELDYGAELRGLVDRYKMNEDIHFVGDVVDIEPFHQATDISVSTSDYETFGMSVCEAMACGKPVIGYDGGSVREVIGNHDCVVPTGDLVGLIRIAERLAGSCELRKAYGEQSRKRVINCFDSPKTFIAIREVYERLLKQ